MSHDSHRWSGWPGAWCLDCGIEDPLEQALADSVLDPITGEFDTPEAAAKYAVPPCPCPGSKQHDPYSQYEA